MNGRTPKVTAEAWVETARRALVEEGISGVKVDRLAQRLGVTRGGFYHNFREREDLLTALLHLWEENCQFLPSEAPGETAAQASEWLDRMMQRTIEEDGYDPHFDLAVREWARSDPRAAWAVERSDRQRLNKLHKFFEALGYDGNEATIRARVLYYHQIGYYAIGVRESISERKRNAHLYSDILCGHDVLARARAARNPDLSQTAR